MSVKAPLPLFRYRIEVRSPALPGDTYYCRFLSRNPATSPSGGPETGNLRHNCPDPPHSARKVIAGSTPAARLAGPAAAINATNTSSATAPASGRGSPAAT